MGNNQPSNKWKALNSPTAKDWSWMWTAGALTYSHHQFDQLKLAGDLPYRRILKSWISRYPSHLLIILSQLETSVWLGSFRERDAFSSGRKRDFLGFGLVYAKGFADWQTSNELRKHECMYLIVFVFLYVCISQGLTHIWEESSSAEEDNCLFLGWFWLFMVVSLLEMTWWPMMDILRRSVPTVAKDPTIERIVTPRLALTTAEYFAWPLWLRDRGCPKYCMGFFYEMHNLVALILVHNSKGFDSGQQELISSYSD